MLKKSHTKKRVDHGLQELYAFFDGMAFPVLLFVYDDRQREAVLHLLENTLAIPYKTEDICQWCVMHRIEYEVFISKLDMILPWRRLIYRRIVQRIGGERP